MHNPIVPAIYNSGGHIGMPDEYPKSMEMLNWIEKEQECLFDDMMFTSAAYTRP